jgi:hypothetical protein
LVAARPSHAASIGTITLTGNVASDFSSSNPSVRVTPVLRSPTELGEAPFISANGWVSGWAIQDIRTSYNASTDTLYVGLDTFKNAKGVTSIFGDADGNGDPGGASVPMQQAGGIDDAHLGGFKSVAVAFAPSAAAKPGAPTIIAGVPADKSEAGSGTDGFTVSHFKGLNLGLAYNFGTSLGAAAGTLAFDPSAAHPGFEFTINHFSKVSGITPSKGYWISAYAGSPSDVVAGEVVLAPTQISAFAAETVPEPATFLAWSLGLGIAVAYRARRRIHTASGAPR